MALFAVFVIVCDLYDFFQSMVSQSGLLNKSVGLFVFELLSLIQAIAVIVIMWRFPRLFLSRRSAEREIDLLRREAMRGQRRDEDPEYLRRQEERRRRLYPYYEDLDIEEVVFDSQSEAESSVPDVAINSEPLNIDKQV